MPAITLAPEAVEALAKAIAAAVKAPVERRTYSPDEAAASLGVARSWFDERVLPDLRVIRSRGRSGRAGRVLIPVEELDRWVAENAERVFDE